MARKAKTTEPGPMPDDAAIFDALFALIAEKGLGKARLSILAQRLAMPLSALYAAFPSVQDILAAFLDHLDGHMVRQTATGGAKRDLYFDMLMNRFDELQRRRPGVRRWLEDLPRHPLLARALLKRWDRTLSLMLDLAQDSPLFPVKKLGLAGIYTYSLREWLRDDSDDMAKTMAAVDRALGRANDFAARYLSPKPAAENPA